MLLNLSLKGKRRNNPLIKAGYPSLPRTRVHQTHLPPSPRQACWLDAWRYPAAMCTCAPLFYFSPQFNMGPQSGRGAADRWEGGSTWRQVYVQHVT